MGGRGIDQTQGSAFGVGDSANLVVVGGLAKVVLTSPKSVDRDTLKANKAVLCVAAPILGLRVSVATCQVHVQALYRLMDIAVPSA